MITPCPDLAQIRACMLDDHIWRHASDDRSPPKSLYFPRIDTNNLWLKAGEYGFFYGQRLSQEQWEVHLALYKHAAGKARTLAAMAVDWFREHFPDATELIARIAADNAHLIALLKRVGFEPSSAPCPPLIRQGVELPRICFIYTLRRHT